MRIISFKSRALRRAASSLSKSIHPILVSSHTVSETCNPLSGSYPDAVVMLWSQPDALIKKQGLNNSRFPILTLTLTNWSNHGKFKDIQNHEKISVLIPMTNRLDALSRGNTNATLLQTNGIFRLRIEKPYASN